MVPMETWFLQRARADHGSLARARKGRAARGATRTASSFSKGRFYCQPKRATPSERRNRSTNSKVTCFWRWSAGNEQKLAREESPNAHPMANQALETPSASNDDSDSPLLTPGLHNFTKAIMKCDIFKNLRWSKLQGMIDSAFLNNLIDSAYTSFLTLHTKRHVRSDCRFTAANFTRIAFPMLVVQPLQQLFHCQNSFRPGERRGQFARMLIRFTWWFLQ